MSAKLSDLVKLEHVGGGPVLRREEISARALALEDQVADWHKLADERAARIVTLEEFVAAYEQRNRELSDEITARDAKLYEAGRHAGELHKSLERQMAIVDEFMGLLGASLVKGLQMRVRLSRLVEHPELAKELLELLDGKPDEGEVKALLREVLEAKP